LALSTAFRGGLTLDPFGTYIGVSAERSGHPEAEPIGVSGVRVPMVGDGPHLTIECEAFVAESNPSRSFELVKHVRDLGFGWVDAMGLPHNHRHRTDFAVCDPARLVLVIPVRKPSGLAEITVLLRNRSFASLGLLCGLFSGQGCSVRGL
jgi:hypothetical protein